MSTYSFLNIAATLIGPGATISLGYGAAVAEEGITAEYEEDKGVLTIGADGSAMHSLRARKNGVLTVRLLKTSPTNALLSAAYDYQALSSANWGKNIVTVTDPVRGDVVSARSTAFRRHAPVTYAETANTNEWNFLVGYLDMVLGAL